MALLRMADYTPAAAWLPDGRRVWQLFCIPPGLPPSRASDVPTHPPRRDQRADRRLRIPVAPLFAHSFKSPFLSLYLFHHTTTHTHTLSLLLLPPSYLYISLFLSQWAQATTSVPPSSSRRADAVVATRTDSAVVALEAAQPRPSPLPRTPSPSTATSTRRPPASPSGPSSVLPPVRPSAPSARRPVACASRTSSPTRSLWSASVVPPVASAVSVVSFWVINWVVPPPDSGAALAFSAVRSDCGRAPPDTTGPTWPPGVLER